MTGPFSSEAPKCTLNKFDGESVIIQGGARGVIVSVVGNGHGDKCSNPGRDWLHFT